ncbi:hypothetical protein [Rhodanobacter sp. C03]|uniref:hypothetical protein n=1 Tax=Rhodanobacter sp. C03 TaxID=1945858 RepID=UPI001115A707|nr:hypothetical protein [Rhodanobacter sp. C03]
MTAFAGTGADQIYQSGIESLAARSPLIVAGKITHYNRVVTSSSAGLEPIPLIWTVSAQIEQLHVIKGAATTTILTFTRVEHSSMVPSNPDIPYWQADYGDLVPGQTAVLFLQGSTGKPATVLPAGEDAGALVILLGDIVRLQEVPGAGQSAAWLDYLRTSRSDKAREAALRVLLQHKTPWNSLAPALESLLKDPITSVDLRGFIFGIVVFAITHEGLAAPQTDPVRFLCREFVAEQNPRSSLQQLLQLKLLLRYTGQSEERQERLPMEKLVIEALNQRAAMKPLPAELEEQYRQIRATYPAVH